MPLLNSFVINKNCIWGVWQISESEQDLHSLLKENIEKEELAHITNPKRRIEWLAARCLANVLINEFTGNKQSSQNYSLICKDEHGKPHIKNSDWHISLSHCSTYAVMILHKTQAVGIDIEQISPKISRIIPRICTETELGWAGDDLSKLTILWCAKEAIYKYYAQKKLDFKTNIVINGAKNEGVLFGEHTQRRTLQLFPISFLENYQIVCCLEIL
jgi:4'-phosphopantetheinyl transferase